MASGSTTWTCRLRAMQDTAVSLGRRAHPRACADTPGSGVQPRGPGTAQLPPSPAARQDAAQPVSHSGRVSAQPGTSLAHARHRRSIAEPAHRRGLADQWLLPWLGGQSKAVSCARERSCRLGRRQTRRPHHRESASGSLMSHTDPICTTSIHSFPPMPLQRSSIARAALEGPTWGSA